MPTNRFFCVTCGTALSGITDSSTGGIQCPSCARANPIPIFAGAVVLPSDILAMEVKFLCTSCQSRLGADARWEGRGVICPVCGDKTRVPRWSGFTHGSRTADVAQGAKAAALSDANLSSEEIAFLSEPTPTIPGAGA